MIKILKKGTETDFEICQCPMCKSWLAYQQRDVEERYGISFYKWTLYKEIKCPVCNNPIRKWTNQELEI